MYHTPGGDRVLTGAERSLFVESLGMIVDMLADMDVPVGVNPFDDLQRNQKLVVLYHAGRALLRPDEPVPKLTAYIESAVAGVYEFIRDQMSQEIDEQNSSPDSFFWRSFILKAARQKLVLEEFPSTDNLDKGTWSFLTQCLSEEVLWDNDFELEVNLDLPPEESGHMRTTLGIETDYYTDIPADPPDDQINLYVDALMGLTAEAR